MKKLPKIHPKYDGVLTYFKDLKIGTKFHVENGDWNGEIIEENGRKKLYVFFTKETHDVSDRFAWITIKKAGIIACFFYKSYLVIKC